MNFYSITIVRSGDCLSTVKNISEIGDSPITDKKVAMKIFNQQKKDLDLGDYIVLFKNGFVINDYVEE